MKIYKRVDFYKLPAGIIYRKNPNDDYSSFGHLEIKGSENDTIDFVCLDFANVNDSDLERMEVLEESRPVDTEMYGRDGCFERDALFLVYETWDLEQLKKIIEKAIVVSPKQEFGK